MYVSRHLILLTKPHNWAQQESVDKNTGGNGKWNLVLLVIIVALRRSIHTSMPVFRPTDGIAGMMTRNCSPASVIQAVGETYEVCNPTISRSTGFVVCGSKIRDEWRKGRQGTTQCKPGPKLPYHFSPGLPPMGQFPHAFSLPICLPVQPVASYPMFCWTRFCTTVSSTTIKPITGQLVPKISVVLWLGYAICVCLLVCLHAFLFFALVSKSSFSLEENMYPDPAKTCNSRWIWCRVFFVDILVHVRLLLPLLTAIVRLSYC